MASTAVARKYTNISFEEIRNHLMEIVRAKEGALADLGDSSYGKLMIELFAGFGDLTANWVESAFENAWIETAFAKPSMYAGARSLGYSIRRPVPAKCSIGIRVAEIREHGTLKVSIPKWTTFTMNGTSLMAMSDMEFSYDYDTDTSQTGLMTLTSGMNVLAEGEVRKEILVSNGQQNQVFYLSDPSFSDYFGDGDPNYADDGNAAQRPSCFTTVTTDATLVDNLDSEAVNNDRLYWRISRRGLEDASLENGGNDLTAFAAGQNNFSDNYTVLMETANDGRVSIRFGDGVNSAIPFGDIEVTYFSTRGETGNMLNVFGTSLSTSGGGITLTTMDGKETEVRLADLNICLATDIRGGLNIESVDSIKNNASAVYSSLDRLVTRTAYKIFLRRYADVKYASAYGEDILNTKLLNGGINVKYINQVRFSAMKDLYREKDGKYYPTTEDEYLLDGYKVNGLMYNWLYDFQDPNEDTTIANATDVIGRISDGMGAILTGVMDSNTSAPLSDEQIATLLPRIEAAVMSKIAYAMPADARNVDESVFSAFLTPLDFVVPGSELYAIMTALNRRGLITVGDGFHNYVYPSVHNMVINMSIVVFKGHNFTDIREKVKQKVYGYLKDNTDFGTPIYRSKIASLVHTMPEVAGVDVTFDVADSAFRNVDLADYPWMGDSTTALISYGTASFSGMTYQLAYTYNGTRYNGTEFTIRSQSAMQTAISDYYRNAVYPKVVSGKITDKLIDRFVAFIWSKLMEEVYLPVSNEMNMSLNAGAVQDASMYTAILRNLKTWDMGADSLTFKNSNGITDMSEVNGSALYDYMRYGMDYIKLVRRVLGVKSSMTLINVDTGNIDNYSNDNEIVQFNIPNDAIDITVAQYSMVASR